MNSFFQNVTTDFADWGYPLLVILLFLVLGVLLDRVLLAQFKRVTEKTPWELDDALVDSARGLPVLWSLLLAGYVLEFRYNWALAHQAYIEKGLLIFFVISMVVFIARFVSTAVASLARRLGSVVSSSSLLVHISRFSIYGLGLLAVLQTLGISILPILAALGVGGLAVSLALQDSLSNLFSGLHSSCRVKSSPAILSLWSPGKKALW